MWIDMWGAKKKCIILESIPYFDYYLSWSWWKLNRQWRALMWWRKLPSRVCRAILDWKKSFTCLIYLSNNAVTCPINLDRTWIRALGKPWNISHNIIITVIIMTQCSITFHSTASQSLSPHILHASLATCSSLRTILCPTVGQLRFCGRRSNRIRHRHTPMQL